MGNNQLTSHSSFTSFSQKVFPQNSTTGVEYHKKLFSFWHFKLHLLSVDTEYVTLGHRVCAGCGNDLHANAYSRRQWSFPVGRSRCRLCVSEGVDGDQSGFGTARTNNATRITINRYDMIGEGAFRYCYSGRYLGGQRTGQA
jgi:hypothetical protein